MRPHALRRCLPRMHGDGVCDESTHADVYMPHICIYVYMRLDWQMTMVDCSVALGRACVSRHVLEGERGIAE